jgi:hypothetical protein
MRQRPIPSIISPNTGAAKTSPTTIDVSCRPEVPSHPLLTTSPQLLCQHGRHHLVTHSPRLQQPIHQSPRHHQMMPRSYRHHHRPRRPRMEKVPWGEEHIGLDIQSWLDRFYMSRIGIRFLIGQRAWRDSDMLTCFHVLDMPQTWH